MAKKTTENKTVNLNDVLKHTFFNDLLAFTVYFFKLVYKTDFVVNWHHVKIAEKLLHILNYEHPTNRLIINCPPRMSKTEMMIDFTALGFGVNPSSEFMFLSASDSLIKNNVSKVRGIMETEEYQNIFKVKLTNDAKGSIVTSNGGVLYAAPFFGQITGFGFGLLNAKSFSGALIIDDPIKTQDALYETKRENINFAYPNTIVSRANDERAPIVIIAQRTHEEDLTGYVLKHEKKIEDGGIWDVITIPAILDEGTPKQRSMWKGKISLDSLLNIKSLNEWVFNTQYQQNPLPIEGLMFSDIQYYEDIIKGPDLKIMFVDPADGGGDYNCSVVLYIKDKKVFVEEVLYDNKNNVDYLYPFIVDLAVRHGVSYVHVESNSAWKIFARALRDKINEVSSADVRFFIAKQNKEVRIFNEAPSVCKNFYFKKGGYDEAMKHLSVYLKMVKGQKDDFPDILTSASNYLKVNGIINVF